MAGLGKSRQDPLRPAGRCASPGPAQATWRPLATTPQSRIVGVAGLVEGFVLVTFPSASAIITGSNHYGMAGPLYGELVLPELATAILASLTGFGLARRHSTRFAYVLGISIGLAAMGLLIASITVERDHPVSYPLLLA